MIKMSAQNPITKKCTGKCAQVKPLDQFWIGKAKCKVCQTALDKDYRAKKKLALKTLEAKCGEIDDLNVAPLTDATLDSHTDKQEIQRLNLVIQEKDIIIHDLLNDIDRLNGEMDVKDSIIETLKKKLGIQLN